MLNPNSRPSPNGNVNTSWRPLQKVFKKNTLKRPDTMAAFGGKAKRKEGGAEREANTFSGVFLHISTFCSRPTALRLLSSDYFVHAGTSGGIVRPICFTAFRLIVNSDFAVDSTG